MKTKLRLVEWEIITFILLNVFYVFSYALIMYLLGYLFVSAAIFTDGHFSAFERVAHLLVFALSLFFIFFNTLFKNFYLFLYFKIVYTYGSEKYKLILTFLRKSYVIKILLVFILFFLDMFFIVYFAKNGVVIPSRSGNFFEKYHSNIIFYYICGSLTLPYLTTFILWQIGDWVKKIRAKRIIAQDSLP